MGGLCQTPFGGPEQVLKYLARYTHRVAISNQRLVSIEDGHVRFEYKDYADGSKAKVMTLTATEFIRRFLLHVLPGGFVRVRQFGFLANRQRRKKLALCRALLGAATPPDQTPRPERKADKSEPKVCPACGVGRLVLIRLAAAPAPSHASRVNSS